MTTAIKEYMCEIPGSLVVKSHLVLSGAAALMVPMSSAYPCQLFVVEYYTLEVVLDRE